MTGKREWPGIDAPAAGLGGWSSRSTMTICGARHHDVAHLHLGDVEHALEHLLGVGIEQPALARLLEHFHAALRDPRLAGQARVMRRTIVLPDCLHRALMASSALSTGIRIGESEPAQHRDLAPLHARGIASCSWS